VFLPYHLTQTIVSLGCDHWDETRPPGICTTLGEGKPTNTAPRPWTISRARGFMEDRSRAKQLLASEKVARSIAARQIT
jgi:hypothetical protein